MPEERPYAHPPRLPEGEHVDVHAFLPATAADQPLEIEIGPGRGGFIYERCVSAPESRILGIEIRRKWATRVDERLAREGQGTRARVVCEDAKEALKRLQPDGCAAAVFIHFPDPWWKKRHTKRLVVVDPLIAEVVRLLQDGGTLLVQTDVPTRADEYQQRLDQVPELEAAGDDPADPKSPRLRRNPYQARSNREVRADEDGLPVHRLHYRRQVRK